MQKTVTQQQKKDLEEKEARLKLLHELLENYKDPGTTFFLCSRIHSHCANLQWHNNANVM